ncbi:hypothetical protein N752_06530 [Desulforamulus aquiferis]|nr:acyl-CoA dehydratase activase-related protein [Desulforamulus aquiferis]RYD06010.1 hypothetical protein N752_06530 [Desulforamulus aquiferis]
MPDEALSVLEGRTKPVDDRETDLTVAVIGHPYNIYDPFISMNIINKLRKAGARFLPLTI